MGLILPKARFYIYFVPFEQDAKLSENGLRTHSFAAICNKVRFRLSIVSDPDVSHQFAKGRLSDYRQIQRFWARSQGLTATKIDPLIEMTSGIFEK